MKPDYIKIFSDIIHKKYPHKQNLMEYLNKKKQLNTLEILKLNEIIFNDVVQVKTKATHRSYDKETIRDILAYQENSCLTNVEIAAKFKLSRNTIAKWKKNINYL